MACRGRLPGPGRVLSRLRAVAGWAWPAGVRWQLQTCPGAVPRGSCGRRQGVGSWNLWVCVLRPLLQPCAGSRGPRSAAWVTRTPPTAQSTRQGGGSGGPSASPLRPGKWPRGAGQRGRAQGLSRSRTETWGPVWHGHPRARRLVGGGQKADFPALRSVQTSQVTFTQARHLTGHPMGPASLPAPWPWDS